MSIVKSIKEMFKQKPFVDADTKAWIFDTYSWALRNLSSDIFYGETVLVLPTNDFFPDKSSDSEELSLLIFERVKKYAGMDGWECELLSQEQDVNPVVSPTVVIHNSPKGPAGTFSIQKDDLNKNKATITYNQNQVKNPQMLIATFAHELSHYLGATIVEFPPGGEEAWEPATDLIAVFIGYGLFLANTAFTSEAFTGIDSQGWSTQTQGYLSENDLIYAISIFCILKKISISSVEPHLKKSLRSGFKKAMKEISKNKDDMEKLRSIK